MTRHDRSNGREPTSARSVWSRARIGALIGVPLGVAVGVQTALAVPDERSLAIWIVYIGGGLFACVTFGAFVGAMSIPRRGDD